MSGTMTSDPTIQRHDRYLTLNYPRYPLAIERGEGERLFDASGRAYLDLFAGFGAGILGHCHPELVAALQDQATRLWHVGNLLHTTPQTLLAERIARMGFGGRSFFCHSGSDANEAAFKAARLCGKGKRFRILSTTYSFHGRGFAAMMATGQDKIRKGFEPYLDGFHSQIPYNDLAAMEKAVDEKTVAIIVEPIQGEGGVHVPDAGYLTGLRQLCDRHDLLLIIDEVWTGCGRTGKTFAYQHWNIEPDILTLGKAIGCGLSLGVMCAGPRAAGLFDSAQYGGVPHATTLGGNCITTAVAAKMLEIIERDQLGERARRLGEVACRKLEAKAGGAIRSVRGKGLFIGVELNLEATRFPDAGACVRHLLLEEGVLIGSAQKNVLRLAPPLTIQEQAWNEGLDKLLAALSC